ncbi:MAG: hypothetical protein OEZ01_04925, partial [Candidatus Heimdallarchaeota archaeon]|nr:hypothetical protein [Candidatus Heimdallarchaeota archaeon]
MPFNYTPRIFGVLIKNSIPNLTSVPHLAKQLEVHFILVLGVVYSAILDTFITAIDSNINGCLTVGWTIIKAGTYFGI